MNVLTKLKGLIKRGRLAAPAIAMLLALTVTSAPAQAQGDNTSGADFRGGVSVGLAKGHTIHVHYSTGFGNYIRIRGSARVYSGSTGALLQSHELTSLIAGRDRIEINRDDLPEEGDPVTGLIQLRIEVEIVSEPTTLEGTEVPEGNTLSPDLGVIDNATGKTVVVIQKAFTAHNFRVEIDGIPR